MPLFFEQNGIDFDITCIAFKKVTHTLKKAKIINHENIFLEILSVNLLVYPLPIWIQ